MSWKKLQVKQGPSWNCDNYFSKVYCRHLLLFLVSVSALGATLSQDNSHAWMSILLLAGSTLLLASITLALIFYYRCTRLRKDFSYSLQRGTGTAVWYWQMKLTWWCAQYVLIIVSRQKRNAATTTTLVTISRLRKWSSIHDYSLLDENTVKIK